MLTDEGDDGNADWHRRCQYLFIARRRQQRKVYLLTVRRLSWNSGGALRAYLKSIARMEMNETN